MRLLAFILLLSAGTTVRAQVAAKGLILDLDGDKGVEVEDGDRVVKWTNQVATFAASDFVKQDTGRKEPGSGRPTWKRSVAAIDGHGSLLFERQELINHEEDVCDPVVERNQERCRPSRTYGCHRKRVARRASLQKTRPCPAKA